VWVSATRLLSREAKAAFPVGQTAPLHPLRASRGPTRTRLLGVQRAPPPARRAVAIPLRNHGRCPGRPDRSVPRWVRPPRTASSPTSTRNETAIQLVSGCPCGHATNHRNGLRTAASARTPQPRDLTDDCGRIGSESNTAAPSDRDGMGECYAGLDIDRSLACYRSTCKASVGVRLRRLPDRRTLQSVGRRGSEMLRFR
jgi:hypothetical protein